MQSRFASINQQRQQQRPVHAKMSAVREDVRQQFQSQAPHEHNPFQRSEMDLQRMRKGKKMSISLYKTTWRLM